MIEDWQSFEIDLIVSTSVAGIATMARCGGGAVKQRLVIDMEAEPHSHLTAALLVSSAPPPPFPCFSLSYNRSSCLCLLETANEFLLFRSGRLSLDSGMWMAPKCRSAEECVV